MTVAIHSFLSQPCGVYDQSSALDHIGQNLAKIESLRALAAVYVVADCDEPERRHAHAVCAALDATGIRVYFIDLAPERSDKHDAFDFIMEHGENARGRLEQLARGAPRWPIEKRSGAPIVSLREFAAGVGPYDQSKNYLAPLPRGGERVHVIGPIGHGKTTFLAEMLSCAVQGWDFLGFQGRNDGIRAIYIDLEMPSELLLQTLRDARSSRTSSRSACGTSEQFSRSWTACASATL